MSTRRGVALALAVLTAAGCRPALRPTLPPMVALARVGTPPRLADDGDPATLADAVRASLAYYGRLPPSSTLRFGADEVAVPAMVAALDGLLAVLATAPDVEVLAAEIRRRFVAYRPVTRQRVLFTGYYLPVLEARATPDTAFRFPILGRPPDLVTVTPADFRVGCPVSIVGRVVEGRLVPYFTRAEITGAAAVGTPILAWVDDPLALFFAQIQGSARLHLADESRPTIGFAVSNGHPYASVGRVLVDEGHLAAHAASMSGIRRWLDAHPEERERVLNANPRYVFFRMLDGPALGSLGVPVTGGRTIATDPAVYPPGALALVSLPPVASGRDGVPPRRLTRVMLNQDTGAAIRGPARVDVFFGEGTEAEAVAGALKTPGELYVLAPRRR